MKLASLYLTMVCNAGEFIGSIGVEGGQVGDLRLFMLVNMHVFCVYPIWVCTLTSECQPYFRAIRTASLAGNLFVYIARWYLLILLCSFTSTWKKLLPPHVCVSLIKPSLVLSYSCDDHDTYGILGHGDYGPGNGEPMGDYWVSRNSCKSIKHTQKSHLVWLSFHAWHSMEYISMWLNGKTVSFFNIRLISFL